MMTEEEKKKTWAEKARETLGRWVSPDKGPDIIQKTLHKAGTDVIADQKLENRIRALYEFQKMFSQPIKTAKLADYVEELLQRTELLNDVISLTAMPYATSANYPLFQAKYSAWQIFYTSAKSLLLHAEEEINPLETESETDEDELDMRKIFSMEHSMLVRFTHEALQKHYWKEGFSFMNQCFRDKHVIERAVTVVQALHTSSRMDAGKFGEDEEGTPTKV